MKILVLGSVAKEHALVRWISQSKEEVKIYAYPGNPGMNGLATVIKRSDLSDVDAVVNIVKSEKIDLIITSTAKLIEEGVTEELQKLIYELSSKVYQAAGGAANAGAGPDVTGGADSSDSNDNGGDFVDADFTDVK